MQFGPRTFLFFVLLLVMPVAAWWFLFKPYDAHLEEIRRDTAAKRQTLQELTIKTAMAESEKKKATLIHARLLDFENKLPPGKETEKAYDTVSALAAKNQVTIKTMKVLNQDDFPGYSQQSIKMVMTGSAQNGFYKFLSEVEQISRTSRISDLSITTDDKQAGMVTVDMTMTIFFENPGKTAVTQ